MREALKEKKELRLTPEVLKAQSFFIGELSRFISEKKLRGIQIAELFEEYKNFINSRANFENFQKLRQKYDETKIDQNKYKKYLLQKLPKELQEKNKDKSIKELEEIHNFRQDLNSRMVLGLHVSGADISERETINKGYSESQIGEIILGAGAYVQYSESPHYLWSAPTARRYLYLVEGSEKDKITHPRGWRARAVARGQKGLEILTKFELTKELEEALGLEFRETN